MKIRYNHRFLIPGERHEAHAHGRIPLPLWVRIAVATAVAVIVVWAGDSHTVRKALATEQLSLVNCLLSLAVCPLPHSSSY